MHTRINPIAASAWPVNKSQTATRLGRLSGATFPVNRFGAASEKPDVVSEVEQLLSNRRNLSTWTQQAIQRIRERQHKVDAFYRKTLEHTLDKLDGNTDDDTWRRLLQVDDVEVFGNVSRKLSQVVRNGPESVLF